MSDNNNDYITHHQDWLRACEIAKKHAENETDRHYWQHQINTLNKLNSRDK